MTKILIMMIRAYQLMISPWIGSHCRFHPTCSNYAKTAFEKHGLLRGLKMSAERLLRCHPWSSGGLDVVK